MSSQYCPECGHEHPAEARFCMNCGLALTRQPAAPGAQRREAGTDWAAIAAAVLAFLSLRHVSRRARNTFLVLAFLMFFFGCPMMCGFVAYVMEWIGRLLH
jgi:hypothetical protein